ncbi:MULTISPECIES: helix-turn-helix domain-containing protein [Providencia]|uniref:helix-turn-helix domain-containing protein n=1 Tax=Providencia TaxID=586 RepID=UPI0019821C81|nr:MULTISPECIES: helix-turn-helix transcriptional regulator [Providencia]MBN4864768.1 helix-turn-helix transcriptional regulator [Providencia stuartii]MBN4873786.1 helix-turn-helix transcriptional regulator [Providencia stuartii]MBN4878477.1 helix-turn-helix transcriptional regulator [Providencia stuartii]MBN4883290.1 helix-turn-helix transcriptional regulator [Providencia stuartii]HEM8292336.1 helix-turn-helix transcriptional regulator [Providencia stuartii]
MLIITKTQKFNIIVGKKIKKYRKEMKLTAEELGQYIGVSQQQISRYESGANHINIDFLAQFSELFKVPIQVFLTDD